MRKTRRKFSGSFKVKVAIEAIKERLSLSEIAKKYEVLPQQITKWKKEFLDKSSSVFDTSTEELDAKNEPQVEKLYAKIGELQLENDFLKKSLKKVSD